MEILLDNPLGYMYGPYFLIFFGFVIFFAVIALALVKSQFDKTDRFAAPSIPPNLDPFEVAYLRGGENEMARAVIFSLLHKGLVEIEGTGSNSIVKRVENPERKARLSEIEETALNWMRFPLPPKDMFNSRGLPSKLENYSQTYQSNLERRQFLVDEQARNSFKPVKWSVFLLIFLLGAYKTFAAIVHGQYNIILLIIFTIGGLVIANQVSKLPRITKLGKIYLERLQTAFETLKYTSQKPYLAANQTNLSPQTTFGAVDPLLLSVGVFGGGILAGTVFDNYNQAFHRSQMSSAGGGSCGSAGCGSCSSGGGSSDGGGGDGGGGGCGGCGGGCS